MTTDVLIVGAGLAGLSCASTLTRAGISSLILEADDDVGGRARTDQLDGFLLDRGFQVFSTAYPEAKHILNYDSLKLHNFYPGALVRFEDRFHRASDPFRYPLHAIQSSMNPIGTLVDKFKIVAWRRRVLTGLVGDLFQKTETTTMTHLQSMGFSQVMIDRFFRPFLGGVFMDQSLRTSSHMADFMFRMFASGDIAIPENGIGALAQQLAQRLNAEQIRTGEKVVNIKGTTITLASGETLTARHVVIATEGPTATQLVPQLETRPYHQTTCLYFSTSEPPRTGPYLILNGETNGIVNSLCVLTQVSPSYAPPGQHLVSVTTGENSMSDKGNIQAAVRSQLMQWFGKLVNNWKHLRTYYLVQAQPDQSPPLRSTKQMNPKIGEGLSLCGDYCATATFDGAIGSGRRAAEEIMSKFKT